MTPATASESQCTPRYTRVPPTTAPAARAIAHTARIRGRRGRPARRSCHATSPQPSTAAAVWPEENVVCSRPYRRGSGRRRVANSTSSSTCPAASASTGRNSRAPSRRRTALHAQTASSTGYSTGPAPRWVSRVRPGARRRPSVGRDQFAHGEIGGQRRAVARGHERDEPGGRTQGERDHGEAVRLPCLRLRHLGHWRESSHGAQRFRPRRDSSVSVHGFQSKIRHVVSMSVPSAMSSQGTRLTSSVWARRYARAPGVALGERGDAGPVGPAEQHRVTVVVAVGGDRERVGRGRALRSARTAAGVIPGVSTSRTTAAAAAVRRARRGRRAATIRCPRPSRGSRRSSRR